MAFTWITDNDLADRVARFLSYEDHADLYAKDPLWPGMVHDGNVRAFQFLQNAVLTRGYTEAQLELWDRGLDFQRRLGVYYTLKEGAVLVQIQDFKNLETLNCEKEVAVALAGGILIAGAFQPPGGSPVETAGASAGQLSATSGRAGDVFGDAFRDDYRGGRRF